MATSTRRFDKLGKVMQLVVAFGCLFLSATFFPGVMVVIPVLAILIYCILSIRALLGFRNAAWSSFAISILVAIVLTAGVARYLSNGFSYLSANWPANRTSLEEPNSYAIAAKSEITIIEHAALPPNTTQYSHRVYPYVFLSLSLMSILVVVLHVLVLFQIHTFNQIPQNDDQLT